MILKIKTLADIPSSEITPESIYRSRRDFMKIGAAGVAGLAAGSAFGGLGTPLFAQDKFATAKKSTQFTVDPKVDPLTPFDGGVGVSTYNNFYEFGNRKTDPARNAGALTVKPWTVQVDGLCNKPGNYGVEDLVDFNQLEERVYRHRCVEAWSMVIPWIGVSLKSVLDRAQPQPKAKFVEFVTLHRPEEMFGQKGASLRWPYVEGLRMDEAMHPLAMMVVGVYNRVLPNQNGAPLRIHIPWKYGFKSGKSIVRIRFTETEPKNSWQVQTPSEYGFYANVNPTVDHPRWTQSVEVRLPGFVKNRPTLMFNGYADQVAGLYAGMDLRKYF
jgi:sulfoxide reductase catalytic subunit YedY